MFYIILDLDEQIHMIVEAASEEDAAKLSIDYLKYFMEGIDG